jgi:hypothetical protein
MVFGCSAPSVGSSEAVVEVEVDILSENTDSLFGYYMNGIDSALLTGDQFRAAAAFFAQNDSLVRQSAPNLMKAGLVCLSSAEHRLFGVEFLTALFRTYPQHAYAPEALMQLGLFFQNEINDPERSANYLRALVDRYPTHPLRADAEALLLFMGGDENETIKNWLKTK